MERTSLKLQTPLEPSRSKAHLKPTRKDRNPTRTPAKAPDFERDLFLILRTARYAENVNAKIKREKSGSMPPRQQSTPVVTDCLSQRFQWLTKLPQLPGSARVHLVITVVGSENVPGMATYVPSCGHDRMLMRSHFLCQEHSVSASLFCNFKYCHWQRKPCISDTPLIGVGGLRNVNLTVDGPSYWNQRVT
jgi:hypothetical protein